MTPREQTLETLRKGAVWDVLVIGGGATGLGTAVDAVSRGYRTLLLERDDFAKGTSSRSTKLIHGGVRYLERGQLGLVREALREREILLKNAPQVVHDREFLVPAHAWGEASYYAAGLWVYDRLAGAKGRGRSRQVDRAEALRMVPNLEPEGLRGGVIYRDGQFDDVRLAVALARTADDRGGSILNRMSVEAIVKGSRGQVVGVQARDAETGEILAIAARGVVNATGVFADEIRRLDEAGAPRLIAPSRGAHLVLDRKFLRGETAMLVPKTDDGRVIFAIPWNGRVIVGTTDTPVDKPVDEPEASRQELDFLLKHAARYLADDPTEADVLSVFAGLRPLIAAKEATSTAKLSREHAVIVAKSGLVTVTGGKWTTYRRMAADAVGQAVRVADLPERPCITADLKLHGWTDQPDEGPLKGYGSDAPAIEALARDRPELGNLLSPSLPYRDAEVVWGVREEGARTVEDVLARRTRALLLDARASIIAAPRVAAILGAELGRDSRWEAEQVEAYTKLAAGYVFPG